MRSDLTVRLSIGLRVRLLLLILFPVWHVVLPDAGLKPTDDCWLIWFILLVDLFTNSSETFIAGDGIATNDDIKKQLLQAKTFR